VRFRLGSRSVWAVRGIDFDVQAGGSLGVVGESGSGKSVSMMSLLRLLPASVTDVSGTVIFGGRDLLALPDAELREIRGGEIGMVFQDPLSSLNPVKTVGSQVAETLAVHRGIRGRIAERRVIDLLGLVGIPDPSQRMGDYPHQFSGGMRQRVMIAAAIACEPRLLIADEPTSALDVTVQAQILDLLARLRQELGMGLVMITHNLGVVARLSDHVNVMYAGRLVERGRCDDVLGAPAHPYTLRLLRSTPGLQTDRRSRLLAIDGSPPDLTLDAAGCDFRPRCHLAIDRCSIERPTLVRKESSREAACWLDEAMVR
jgi:peptide/nickel transport system ATP-binding protein/oligopeptide transport system ATP-binding protein